MYPHDKILRNHFNKSFMYFNVLMFLCSNLIIQILPILLLKKNAGNLPGCGPMFPPFIWLHLFSSVFFNIFLLLYMIDFIFILIVSCSLTINSWEKNIFVLEDSDVTRNRATVLHVQSSKFNSQHHQKSLFCILFHSPVPKSFEDLSYSQNE